MNVSHGTDLLPDVERRERKSKAWKSRGVGSQEIEQDQAKTTQRQQFFVLTSQHCTPASSILFFYRTEAFLHY